MWAAEIIDRETHERQWIGSFHTTDLAAIEYDWWQVRYHGRHARLNFPFGTAPVHLVPLELGLVSTLMAPEDHEAREHIKAEAAGEVNMDDLCQQYPELVEVEQAIFTVNDGEFIIISDNEGGNKRGKKGGEEEMDVEEWQSIFPGDDDDGMDRDPALTEDALMRKDWLDLQFDRV